MYQYGINMINALWNKHFCSVFNFQMDATEIVLQHKTKANSRIKKTTPILYRL